MSGACDQRADGVDSPRCISINIGRRGRRPFFLLMIEPHAKVLNKGCLPTIWKVFTYPVLSPRFGGAFLPRQRRRAGAAERGAWAWVAPASV
jgi:hypothetical protein